MIEKNPPKKVKLHIAIKVVEFGIELLSKGKIENICPEMISVTHFSVRNADRMTLSLVSLQHPRDKIRLYQAPEVLVGQRESSKSLCWTIGIIIDKLFRGRLFY